MPAFTARHVAAHSGAEGGYLKVFRLSVRARAFAQPVLALETPGPADLLDQVRQAEVRLKGTDHPCGRSQIDLV